MTVADQFAELNGIKFRYRDWGGDGELVLLLHGLASSAHIWDFVAPLLAEGNRVVALDQRGHGLTDKPDSGYDYETVAADAIAFIDHLEAPSAVVIGHSWGASVAVELASRHQGRIRAIGLLDGGISRGGPPPEGTWEDYASRMAPPDLTHLTPRAFIAGSRQRWGQLRSWTPELEAVLMSLFDMAEDGTIRPRFPRAQHMLVVRAMWENRGRNALASVTCPILVMPARRPSNDERSQEMMRRREESLATLAASMPNLTVRWLEDSVHDVPLQRPELVAETISAFLQSIATSVAA
jgi:pimeloyl-ACP methyl ester carboxylesterase